MSNQLLQQSLLEFGDNHDIDVFIPSREYVITLWISL